MNYEVQEFIDAKGLPQVRINFLDEKHHGVQDILADNLEKSLRKYIYLVNGADISDLGDVAMMHQERHVFVKPINLASYGGINFDPANLDMEESGQKIYIHFDKAQVAAFKRRGVAGFYPRLISIEEMADVLSLFGLNKVQQSALN